ncbi:MAG: hypothetical protein AAGA76_10920, partial [Pseudomonadota bacterium]
TEFEHRRNQAEISPIQKDIELAALQPIEPGAKESGDIALPVRNPVAKDVEQDSAREVAQSIPIPVPAQRTLLVASSSQEIYSGDASIRRLESLQSISIEERITGKWALAANASIADIAEIRPPAYARNIIRELPSTVLSRGFVQDQRGQLTNSFSGSSLEFLDFTNFK